MGWAIAVAGDIPVDLPPEKRLPREAALRHCLDVGTAALQDGHSPLHVIELVVREQFNAGRGSVLTTDGTVEMEASIMDGQTMNCGAVCGLKTVVNPISLARLVMEKTPHVFLAYEGAEAFAREQGVETADPNHFVTPENIERLNAAKEAKRVQIDYTQPIPKEVQVETHTAGEGTQLGTVGCVAVDCNGNLASATSTGGMVNKMVGRIGDRSVIGAGTYANNYCAVSVTGKGETSIRGTFGRDVAALVEFKGLPLKQTTSYVVDKAERGTVGLIAVSATGEIAMPFNTTGMFRASASQDGH